QSLCSTRSPLARVCPGAIEAQPRLETAMIYPLGYLAVAFRHKADAAQVLAALIAGGYESADVQLVPKEAVVERATRALDHAGPPVRVLGWEHEALTAHVELARRGFTFML